MLYLQRLADPLSASCAALTSGRCRVFRARQQLIALTQQAPAGVQWNTVPPMAAEGLCGLNPPHGQANDFYAQGRLDVSLSEKLKHKMDGMLKLHSEASMC